MIRKLTWQVLLWSLFVACAAPQASQAAAIDIENFSFELGPDLGPTGVSHRNDFWENGPNHVENPPFVAPFGRFRGSAHGQDAPPTDGSYIAYFAAVGSTDVYQDLTAAYQSNTDYLFQIDISARTSYDATRGMRLVLYSGGNLGNEVASLALDGTQVINDQFNTYSFTATAAQVSAASAVGQTIGIRLLGTGSLAGDFDLDNVRLTATPIPEPASLALFSLVGLMLARRKRYG